MIYVVRSESRCVQRKLRRVDLSRSRHAIYKIEISSRIARFGCRQAASSADQDLVFTEPGWQPSGYVRIADSILCLLPRRSAAGRLQASGVLSRAWHPGL